MTLPSVDESPSIAVRCCPGLLKLRNPDVAAAVVGLPHRSLFAVATLNSVTLYDTEQPYPVAMVSNLHYDKLTDVAWCVHTGVHTHAGACARALLRLVAGGRCAYL
jgi:hypothetical protein